MMNKIEGLSNAARSGEPTAHEGPGQDRHGLHVYHPRDTGDDWQPSEADKASTEAARQAKELARAEIAEAHKVLEHSELLYRRDAGLALVAGLSAEMKAELDQADRSFFDAKADLDRAIGQIFSPGNYKIETPEVIASLTEKLRQVNNDFEQWLKDFETRVAMAKEQK